MAMVEWCPKCNAMLTPGQEKCPRCGTRLRRKDGDEKFLDRKTIFYFSAYILGILLLMILVVMVLGAVCLAVFS